MKNSCLLLFAMLLSLGAMAQGTIVGPTYVCIGNTATFTNATLGGRWSVMNPSIATVHPITGVFTATNSGVGDLVYTLGSSSVSKRVYSDSWNVVLGFIMGPDSVCVGSTTEVYKLTGHLIWGITWSASNPAVFLNDSISRQAGIGQYYTKITGVSVGTATISYFENPGPSNLCYTTREIRVVPGSCTGTPAAGTVIGSNSTTCFGQPNTIYLSGHSTGCGIAYHWQSSTDSSTWTGMRNELLDTLICRPIVSTYYRCKVSCAATGMVSYSNGLKLAVKNFITSHSVIPSNDTLCRDTRFCLRSCGYTTTVQRVTTYFGDGQSANNPLVPSSGCNGIINHRYAAPGTYSIKHILYDDGIATDTMRVNYQYQHCNTFYIKLFYDANANCINDLGDNPLLSPASIRVDSNDVPIDTISTISGLSYKGFGPVGTVYTFRVISPANGLVVSCPTSGLIRDTIRLTVGNYKVKQFALVCGTSSGFDLQVYSTVICGRHQSDGTIYIPNTTSCDSIASTVTLNFSPKYAFTSSVPAPLSVIGNTVTWSLPPFRYTSLGKEIKYRLDVPDCWDTAARDWDYSKFLIVGDTIRSTISINPTQGDVDTGNNVIVRVDTVTAAYDPNDISVSPKGLILPCTKLTYTVRFENTGNGPSTNVHVQDTLPDNVDLRSLEMVMASHPMNLYTTTETGQNIVKFDFPNIMLADSSQPEANKGTFVFTVKTKSGLADGVVIPNRVGIYFDINEVVMTNTVENTIGMAHITGPDSMCRGGTIGLACATEGGVWASTNAAVTVTNGLVPGNTLGTSTISYTVSNECTSRTKTKVVTIEPSVTPTISVAKSPDADTFCAGIPVTFTATGSYTGAMPRYTWQVNGTNTHTGSSYNYVPKNADAVTATLTSSGHCAVPAQVAVTSTMHVQDTPALAVSISAVPGLSIWKGQGVTFTATATTDAATYQWLVNGSTVVGATSATYSSTTLAQGDQVSCKVTVGGICGDIATTGMATVTVTKPNDVPVLSPNPTNGTFTIAGWLGHYTDEAVPVDVTDAVGRVYYRDQLSASYGVLNASITLPRSIARGVYFFIIRSKTGIRVLRFVVQ